MNKKKKQQKKEAVTRRLVLLLTLVENVQKGAGLRPGLARVAGERWPSYKTDVYSFFFFHRRILLPVPVQDCIGLSTQVDNPNACANVFL